MREDLRHGRRRRGRGKKRITGERLGWLKLAFRLGVPVQRLKRESSSTDFMDMMAFLEWEVNNDFHRQDHYLAQIAKEIANAFRGKGRRPIQIKDRLLKFESKKAEEPDEEELRARAKRSKQIWTLSIRGFWKRKSQ